MVGRGHVKHPAFAPSSSEAAVEFLLFLSYPYFPQWCMHEAIFSSLSFVFILLFEETFVQVQAPQQRVSGPTSQPVSRRGANLQLYHLGRPLRTGQLRARSQAFIFLLDVNTQSQQASSLWQLWIRMTHTSLPTITL